MFFIHVILAAKSSTTRMESENAHKVFMAKISVQMLVVSLIRHVYIQDVGYFVN